MFVLDRVPQITLINSILTKRKQKLFIQNKDLNSKETKTTVHFRRNLHRITINFNYHLRPQHTPLSRLVCWMQCLNDHFSLLLGFSTSPNYWVLSAGRNGKKTNSRSLRPRTRCQMKPKYSFETNRAQRLNNWTSPNSLSENMFNLLHLYTHSHPLTLSIMHIHFLPLRRQRIASS